METEKIKIKTLIIVIASIVFIEIAAAILASKSHPDPMIILGIVRLLEISMIILVVMVWGNGLSCIGLGTSTIVRGIKKGLLWSAFFGLATSIVFLVLYFSRINPLILLHNQLPEKNTDIFLFLTVGCIVGPFAEELFFRGILYGFFRKWGILPAIIITTMIFVISHRNISAIPVTQIIGGVTFAIAYEIESSLMVPIIIHILGNMAIYIIPSVW